MSSEANPLPILIKLVERNSFLEDEDKLRNYGFLTLLVTYFANAFLHMARKPISVVQAELFECEGNCSSASTDFDTGEDKVWFVSCLDSSFLFPFAVCTFFSGWIADRVDMRRFLALGLVLSGLATALFGLGRVWRIHHAAFYLSAQVLSGMAQSCGLPVFVAIIANWYGRHAHGGLVFGVWNSNGSVGNLLGNVIAGVFVDVDWALSFIVPGLLTTLFGIFVFFVLIPSPTFLNLNTSNDDEYEDLDAKPKPMSCKEALRIPGVIDFACCYFFIKLVFGTLLFWLPSFIERLAVDVEAEKAADIATTFDLGCIIGGILSGLLFDVFNGKGGFSCMLLSMLATPTLMAYLAVGRGCPLNGNSIGINACDMWNIFLLLLLGIFVYGLCTLLSTAVPASLGLNSSTLATVTAIIDGSGSLGAALGPFMIGWFPAVEADFVMLLTAMFLAAVVSKT